MSEATKTCTVPPAGWRCTRDAGHEGPCAAVPTREKELAQRWCWFHEGDERVTVLSSESEAHGEAQQWVDDNCEPGEEHEYLVAPMKSGLDLLPSAQHIGDTIFESISENLSDDMAAEEDPIDLTQEDRVALGELVRQFFRDRGHVQWWTVDTKNEAKHQCVAGSNDQAAPEGGAA